MPYLLPACRLSTRIHFFDTWSIFLLFFFVFTPISPSLISVAYHLFATILFATLNQGLFILCHLLVICFLFSG